MKNKCKCKHPNEYSIIEGIGVRCERCLGFILLYRERFHKETVIKKNKKKYNRKKAKRNLKRSLQDENI